MRNIFFDLCAIPTFIVILTTCRLRKMSHGRGNRLFILLNILSLICAVSDLFMELLVSAPPLSTFAIVVSSFLSYTYKLLRNSSLVVYLMFLCVITRTDYLIRSPKTRLILWLPIGVLAVLLIQNLFTHNVFTISANSGYTRGPMLVVFYAVALLYGIVGSAYCIYCERYLSFSKWIALFSIYILTFISVFIQLIRSDLLVEMFFTSVSLEMIMLIVMRPDESMNSSVGVQSWQAYQTDISNTILARQPVQIVVIHLTNAQEIRTYLGDELYNPFVEEISKAIRSQYRQHHIRQEMYFERPGTFYVTFEDAGLDVGRTIPAILNEMSERASLFANFGLHFAPRICIIRYPEDLTTYKAIINLGHRFVNLGSSDKVVMRASDLKQSGNFEVENHMEEILNRALVHHSFEMYYQPIYSIKDRRFHSAEALIRLNDSVYGTVLPSLFIPAAEKMGMISLIGDTILESVFRFIGSCDMEALGLEYIEVNLSVAQCMQKSLPETLRRFQEKYGVKPSQVNLEITETTFENISDTASRNLHELSRMGYSFSLDDYGTGYSNIQRLRELPLSIIKIDKTLVDQMFTKDGKVILVNTVRMMQGIDKQLVVEGVETKRAANFIAELSCDYIQGYYYSKPLSAEEFVRFLRENNVGDTRIA